MVLPGGIWIRALLGENLLVDPGKRHEHQGKQIVRREFSRGFSQDTAVLPNR